MDHTFCPGSKLLRQPAPETYACPSCGEEVEMWTDELKASCRKCSRTVYRDNTMSCLDWCAYGKECVGDAVFDTYIRNKAVGLKRRLLDEMSRHFGTDQKRIRHAKEVLRYAETLLEKEDGDWHVVVPSAVLHDVGIKAVEEANGSDHPPHEKAGPPIARKVLLRLGFKMEDVDQICRIIAHHHQPQEGDGANFGIVYDADFIVNLEEAADGKSMEHLRREIEESLFTHTGRQVALEKLEHMGKHGHHVAGKTQIRSGSTENATSSPEAKDL